MSDVLQTAMNYRNRLKSELGKVEEFLRMAEEFSKGATPDSRLAFSKPAEKGAPVAEQSPIDRLRPAARSAASA